MKEVGGKPKEYGILEAKYRKCLKIEKMIINVKYLYRVIKI